MLEDWGFKRVDGFNVAFVIFCCIPSFRPGESNRNLLPKAGTGARS